MREDHLRAARPDRAAIFDPLPTKHKYATKWLPIQGAIDSAN
jgi:hypothetical protein